MPNWIQPKIVKRCPSGHAMEIHWRTCPKCTGRAEAIEPVRNELDLTISGAEPALDSQGSLCAKVSPGGLDTSPVHVGARLRRAGGAGRDSDIEIGPEPVKLGKSPSVDGRSRLVMLDDDYVSRDHAILELGAEGLVVQDLNSKNGTYVNDCRVQRAVLRAGDRLRVGMTDLWVAFP